MPCQLGRPDCPVKFCRSHKCPRHNLCPLHGLQAVFLACRPRKLWAGIAASRNKPATWLWPHVPPHRSTAWLQLQAPPHTSAHFPTCPPMILLASDAGRVQSAACAAAVVLTSISAPRSELMSATVLPTTLLDGLSSAPSPMGSAPVLSLSSMAPESLQNTDACVLLGRGSSGRQPKTTATQSQFGWWGALVWHRHNLAAHTAQR